MDGEMHQKGQETRMVAVLFDGAAILWAQLAKLDGSPSPCSADNSISRPRRSDINQHVYGSACQPVLLSGLFRAHLWSPILHISEDPRFEYGSTNRP